MPVADGDEAVGVHRADVAGVQPAVAQRLGGGLGPVPVAHHVVRAAQEDLARLARRAVLAVGVDYAHVGVEVGAAGGAGALSARPRP